MAVGGVSLQLSVYKGRVAFDYNVHISLDNL